MDVLFWVLGLTVWLVVGFLVAWWFGRVIRNRDRNG